MKPSPLGVAISVVALLSVTSFALQLIVLRPRLWPAGPGMVLSGGSLMATLAEPPAVSVATLPDPRPFLGQPVTIARVWPGGAAWRAGLRPGEQVRAIEDQTGYRVDIGAGVPAEAVGAMDLWRRMYTLSPTGPLTLDVADVMSGATRSIAVARPPVWSLDAATFAEWFRDHHFGPLAKHFTYTLAALLVVALGARGLTAWLLTLAFLLMGVTDVGLPLGAERVLPGGSPLLLGFAWLVLPLAFPVIGLAVLHLPRPPEWLHQRRWVVWLLWMVPAPLAVVGLMATAHLLGNDASTTPLAWVAMRPWAFGALFTLGLATNIAIVAEGVHRYHCNPDATERRRLETIVITAVPGLVAYTLLTGLPVASTLVGTPLRWPWQAALLLQIVVVLSAVGLAWAVAVRRALSPRTVLRQGLQYALARRTLALLTALPGVLLAVSLIEQREQPLGAIISGRPLFYVTALVLIVASLRYRDRAQQWLDRRFFRTEYDAKEILLALASRVPAEPDPQVLVERVVADIDSALHPEWSAVLADTGRGRYSVVHARGPAPDAIDAGSGLVQLLRWSDTPFEVLAGDDRSPAARLPSADRAWLEASGAALLVPVFAGSGSERPLVGVMALGPKRSEEPYSGEDQRLLAGIAGQLGLAADLWRLRRQARTTPAGDTGAPRETTGPTRAQGVHVGAIVDGKYRVDALIGRGGMGAVYRARDLRLDRDVAIKVVRGELVASSEARERFRREAQMAARLHHPAIVTVFDFGTLEDGSAYLVMEYVRGQDLRARLRSGALDPAEGVRLLATLAEAVEAAHREHVLHRDLKPENVLMAEPGGGLKVLDFGVAKVMGSGGGDGTITSAGTIVGTPAYMAPEQIRGGPVDARADVYSLGVIGYELLTGKLPYGAGSFVDVAVRQADTEQALDTTTLPPPVADVLRRALAFAPADRPPTASALAADLSRAIADSPNPA